MTVHHHLVLCQTNNPAAWHSSGFASITVIYAPTPDSRQSLKNVENCCLVVCAVHSLNLLRAGSNCACVCMCVVVGGGGRERGKREKQTHRERQKRTDRQTSTHRERQIEGRGEIGGKWDKPGWCPDVRKREVDGNINLQQKHFIFQQQLKAHTTLIATQRQHNISAQAYIGTGWHFQGNGTSPIFFC